MKTAALAAVAVAGAAVAACGGGGGTTTTVRTVPVPQVTLTARTLTGIAEVDHLIAAAEAKDVIELAALTGYQHVACDLDAEDGTDVPRCRDNESSGDEVEVLASSACDRTWVRPEQVPDAYRAALSAGDVKLFAVYEPDDTDETFGSGFGAQHVIVLLVGARPDGAPAALALHVKDGRVAWFERECEQALELVAGDRVRSFLVAPAGTPSATGTPEPAVPPDATETPAE